MPHASIIHTSSSLSCIPSDMPVSSIPISQSLPVSIHYVLLTAVSPLSYMYMACHACLPHTLFLHDNSSITPLVLSARAVITFGAPCALMNKRNYNAQQLFGLVAWRNLPGAGTCMPRSRFVICGTSLLRFTHADARLRYRADAA